MVLVHQPTPISSVPPSSQRSELIKLAKEPRSSKRLAQSPVEAEKAKRQKQQAQAAKKKEDEKLRREEAKRKTEEAEITRDTTRACTTMTTISIWDEYFKGHHQILKNEYVPILKKELTACDAEARIRACHETIRFIESHQKYNREENAVMKEVVNDKKPRFNTEAS